MTVARRSVAVAGALAFGVGLLGWVDLTATWSLNEPGTVTDVAWGCLAGLLVPTAFLAQIAAPRTDALWLAAAAALGCVVAAATQTRFLVVAGAAAAVAALLWRLGGRSRAARVQPRPILLVLATALAAPAIVWAVRLAGQRSALGDAHVTLDAVPALTAFVVAAAAAAYVAALTGSRITVVCVGIAVGYLGIASITSPHDEASAGIVWGALATTWAVVFVVAGVRR